MLFSLISGWIKNTLVMHLLWDVGFRSGSKKGCMILEDLDNTPFMW